MKTKKISNNLLIPLEVFAGYYGGKLLLILLGII